jgi:hypothetical protein
MSDQFVAEAATYTTHNKHKRRTYMPSAGFEPAIPAIKRPQTYASDRTATGIGHKHIQLCKFLIVQFIHTNVKLSVISGFRRDVDEICALLGYYAASSGQGSRSVGLLDP